VFHGVKATPLLATATAAEEKLFAASGVLLAAESENLFGEWCIADIGLAMRLNCLVTHGDLAPEKLIDYAYCQWQRPSVRH
jgi:glutathione S-transferase